MTQSRPTRTGCLIVGGGPAGMVLGLLLARAGIDVTVLEKHADFLRDFRGDTVHPSTMQLLDEVGLGETFARLPQSRVEQVTMPRADGGYVVLGDLSRLKVSHPYIAMVPQWDLLDLLADAAGDEPSFHLEMQTEATGLVRDGNRVAGVSFRTANGDVGQIIADVTVACDGRWSLLRRESGLRTTEFAVPMDAWWFRLPRSSTDPDPRGLLPVAGNGRMAILIPRPDYYQIAYLGRKGSDGALRAHGLAAFRSDIAELVPWLADRTEALETLDDVRFLDVRLDRLRRWHVDGLVCIGDAAHAMSPVGGVGINLAVQDAVATATLLADPLSRRRVRSTDLARIRRRRLIPTVSVQLMQRLMHRAVIEPILGGQRSGPPTLVLRLVRAVPAATVIPAYLIGVGLRPEHAPEFARRPS